MSSQRSSTRSAKTPSRARLTSGSSKRSAEDVREHDPNKVSTFPTDNIDDQPTVLMKELASDLQDVDARPSLQLLQMGKEELSEAIMDCDGEGTTSVAQFNIGIPKPQDAQLITTKTAKLGCATHTSGSCSCNTSASNLDYYKSIGIRGLSNEADVFETLDKMESIVPSLNDPDLERLWTYMHGTLIEWSKNRCFIAARDLLSYLISDTSKIEPYIRCYRQFKPYIRYKEDPLGDLENRVTSLVASIQTSLKEQEAHQDEVVKFSNQLTQASSTISSLVSSLEANQLKIAKLDLLPPQPRSKVMIDLPSSSRSGETKAVELIDFGVDGEYHGLYRIKVRHGKIETISDTNHLECLDVIPRLDPKLQHGIINSDQQAMINQLSLNPTLRKLFSNPETVITAIKNV